jgi:hypothetical protein
MSNANRGRFVWYDLIAQCVDPQDALFALHSSA